MYKNKEKINHSARAFLFIYIYVHMKYLACSLLRMEFWDYNAARMGDSLAEITSEYIHGPTQGGIVCIVYSSRYLPWAFKVCKHGF